MEEEKAAAYYQDLVRRGSNAARFKQGLGFDSSSAADASADGGDGGAVWTKGGAGLTFVAAKGGAASFERENLEPPNQKSPGGGAAPIAETFAESFERKLQAGLAEARVASVRDKLRRGGSDGGNAGRRADRGGDEGRSAERKDVRAQQLKERMAQQFQRAAAKEAATDKATGLGGEWERFEFDSAAPLEEERDADADVDDADPTAGMASADALGGAHDLAHLDQIKFSFVFSSFSNRGAATQEAHENAIFGAPPTAASEKLPRGHSSKASEGSRKDGQRPDKTRQPSDQGREERAGERGAERRSENRRDGWRDMERDERRDRRRGEGRGDGQDWLREGSRDRREGREGGRGKDERNEKEKEKEKQHREKEEQQTGAASSGGGCAAAVESKFSLSGRKGGSSSSAAGAAAPDAFTAAVAAALGVEEEDDEESVPVIVGLVVDTRPAGESTRNAAFDTVQPHAQAVQDEDAGVPAGTPPLEGGLAGEAAGAGRTEGGVVSVCNGQQQAAARQQVASWKQRALQLKAARAASQQQ
ncbi:unnamed protein product [Closterium sp. Naga37s-1]|nr:unnamed protein product [Closterium sp. Naga37s-1]